MEVSDTDAIADTAPLVQQIAQSTVVFQNSMKLLTVPTLRLLVWYLKNYRRYKIIPNFIARVKLVYDTLDSDFKKTKLGNEIMQWQDLIVRDAYILDEPQESSVQLLRNRYVAELEDLISTL